MKRENLVLAITVVGTTASMVSMLFTASVAMKCNGRIVHWIERALGTKIAEEKEPKKVVVVPHSQ